jgi:hypothetical protein
LPTQVYYSAHQYWDKDNTGAYPLTYAQELALDATLATRASTRLKVFSDWCVANSVKGHIREMGVPNDSNWLALQASGLTFCGSNSLSTMCWAMGGINGSAGTLSIEPSGGADAPQVAPWLTAAPNLPRLST